MLNSLEAQQSGKSELDDKYSPRLSIHSQGMFYAVHSDSGVCAFDINDILATLGLEP